MNELPPSNLAFLFAAFALTWVIFFAYAFFLSRRREELQREIRELRETNDGPESSAGGESRTN